MSLTPKLDGVNRVQSKRENQYQLVRGAADQLMTENFVPDADTLYGSNETQIRSKELWLLSEYRYELQKRSFKPIIDLYVTHVDSLLREDKEADITFARRILNALKATMPTHTT